MTTITIIDGTCTKINFFEFWFFCWVTKSTYYERLRRFLRLLKRISLQLQLYVKWKSYAIGESSFDKLCKNCRYSHKNQLFWVLIFLLSHKFVILLPPKRIWSYSKKWACSATLKITVFFIFAIVRVRLHSPYHLDILSGYKYLDILHSEFTKFTIWNIRILIFK